jgi:uncharacterized membrane protein YkvA (DUF1232 family)
LSPVDLIPYFIPVIGYLDDLLIVPVGILLAVKLVPADLMREFRVSAAIPEGERALGKLGAAVVARRELPVAVSDVQHHRLRRVLLRVCNQESAIDDPLSATEFQQWADWALSQADRIDPVLSGSFRTVQDDD